MAKSVDTPVSTENEQNVTLGLGLKKLDVGTKNIYYDFEQAALKPESLNELNEILSENPTMMERIGNHTDSQGGTVYNYSLSERRAISVIKLAGCKWY